MKTYYATDSNIHPQQVQARPMNSMTHAMQIEGIDPLEYNEHGLGGYYATWQDDGKDCSGWFPREVFAENYQLAHSVPNSVTVNINANCETQAIAKAKHFADMFYTDSAYSATVCKKATDNCYVVVMGNDTEQCEKTALQRVADWQSGTVTKDKVSEVANRALHAFDVEQAPSVPTKTIVFLAMLLSTVCLLAYCSQQNDLALAQQEAAMCR